ncbi:hypothetical protein [Tenacibaculum jejuense]|uniref:Uncharacterized protein n=1 Tax=Tenacibaculum jejuense TaxID=584609 RepID=A0A238U4C9_9FLAO|nr:hypothetical protein [Tenacibaculum jejuense]SNR13876.1 protein of unknown function [Tenacibaculum jejuense]
MKKGCLIIFFTLTILIVSITGYIILFPEKPASEKTKKEILLAEFNQIEDTEKLNKKIEVLFFLEKNKHIILDSLRDVLNRKETYFNLDTFSKREPRLPIKLLNELSKISSNDRIDYQLRITENEKFSLTSTITDYKNYLYIIRDFSRIDSLNIDDKIEKLSKTILIKDNVQYKLTIKDAFNDIDPNNFAPN